MTEDLRIGVDFLSALSTYAQAAHLATQEAAQIGMETLQKELRIQARNHPRWHQAQDHIQVWAEDGHLVVGVAPELQSEAMSAEYGDADHPPVPLLRNHPAAERAAVEAMNAHIESIFGVGAV